MCLNTQNWPQEACKPKKPSVVVKGGMQANTTTASKRDSCRFLLLPGAGIHWLQNINSTQVKSSISLICSVSVVKYF